MDLDILEFYVNDKIYIAFAIDKAFKKEYIIIKFFYMDNNHSMYTKYGGDKSHKKYQQMDFLTTFQIKYSHGKFYY